MTHISHFFGNTYYGFTKSNEQMSPPQQRQQFFLEHIQKHQFDVVILLEMFENSSIGISFPYIYHEPSAGYYIASTNEIKNIQIHETDMKRGILSFEIYDILYVVTHIPPSTYTDRPLEEGCFLRFLQNIPKPMDTMIFADFNTSPSDAFVQDQIQSLGWSNILEPTKVDYILQHRTSMNTCELAIHDVPQISDHPFFHFFIQKHGLQAQLQAIKHGIKKLNMNNKIDSFLVWKDWVSDVQQEYETSLRGDLRNFFVEYLDEFQQIRLIIEYYEDSDFYEFWSIDIECSNQTLTVPTHWLNMSLCDSKLQFWSEDLQGVMQQLQRQITKTKNITDEMIWKYIQCMYLIVSDNTAAYYAHPVW